MPVFSSDLGGLEPFLPAFYQDVFTASEGAEEGSALRALVADLLATTEAGDLFGVTAQDGDELLGCILFSRLAYDQDARQVFLMSPVAVRTERQKTGIGQQLIRFGLDALRGQGVDVVMTYGDPAYYGKTGFQPVTEDIAPAPMPLSMPFGWLGQALDGGLIGPFAGPARCVPAFNAPGLW